MKTKIIIFLIILALSGLLITYFISSQESASPSVRAQERWDALIKGDVETAYKYQTPGYRDTYPLHAYSAGFGSIVTWKTASIFSSEIVSENLAKIKIQLTYIPPGSKDGLVSTVFTEKWLKTGNTWYYTKEK